MKDTTSKTRFTTVTFVVACASMLLGTSPAGMQLAAQRPITQSGTSAAHRLAGDFQDWMATREESGNGGQLVVGLGWAKGLSTEPTTAFGQAFIDIAKGSVRVECAELADPEQCEVWLIDNQPGFGRTVLPEAGDVMINLGALESDGKLQAALDPDVTAGFEPDLVVVARAGQEPNRGLLYGAPTLFQRLSLRAASSGATSSVAASSRAALSVEAAPHAIDQLVAKGEQLFFNETFRGNRRTCGTCHPAENNLTIDSNFIATLPDDDPLFVAEFIPALRDNFEKPQLMRQLGLILENTDGFDDLENKFTMRGVPHVLAMPTSMEANTLDGTTVPPVQRTGWSGDGSPGEGSLRLFAVGAVVQHFPRTLNRQPGVDFRLPTDDELDALEAFQLSTGRQRELDLSAIELDSAVAARGKALFLGEGKCNLCHANAGANVMSPPAPGIGNFNFNTGVENLPDQPADLIDAANPIDGGFGRDPNPAGGFGNGSFNTPVLVEAADTGPFFHNNSVSTIEQAVGFYNSDAFNNSPAAQILGPIDLETTQVEAIAAFLRVLNALENLRSSHELERRVLALDEQLGHPQYKLCWSRRSRKWICVPQHAPLHNQARHLLELSIADLEDGIEVLRGAGLHPDAVAMLQRAIGLERAAMTAPTSIRRKQLIKQASITKQLARAELVTSP
jgi:mono/diheme cytochrome c family protein